MAYYLVRARPVQDKLHDLRSRLDSGGIAKMRPFGRALDFSLREAKWKSENLAVWEEEDYCHPPLAQERAAVLDDYFTDLRVTPVQRGDGWSKIEGLPSMWKDKSGNNPQK